MVNPMEETLVRCKTTAGPFTLQLKRSLSPIGYDRAVELFERGFYDHSYFFRVVKNFLVQFGISYTEDKELQKFAQRPIQDDPPKGIKFKKGTVSYAGSGPNSRTSHLFIAYRGAHSFGRELWETPIGEVIEGMDNVEKFYSYGDMPPWGKGPDQQKVHSGPSYMEENFPKTDKFIKCRTERLNAGQDDDDANVKIVKKSDHITDEEHFAEARQKEKEEGMPARSRLNSPLKTRIDHGKELIQSGDMAVNVGALAFLVVVLIALLIKVSSRKKISSKSN